MDDSFVGLLILVSAALIIATVGGLVVAFDVRYECVNFGKTRVLGQWYECKPIKQEK